MALCDAGISTEPSDITLTAEIYQGRVLVMDVIRVRRAGTLLATIVEVDHDGDFCVLSTATGATR